MTIYRLVTTYVLRVVLLPQRHGMAMADAVWCIAAEPSRRRSTTDRSSSRYSPTVYCRTPTNAGCSTPVICAPCSRSTTTTKVRPHAVLCALLPLPMQAHLCLLHIAPCTEVETSGVFWEGDIKQGDVDDDVAMAEEFPAPAPSPTPRRQTPHNGSQRRGGCHVRRRDTGAAAANEAGAGRDSDSEEPEELAQERRHLRKRGIRSEKLVQRDGDDDDDATTQEKGDNARILRALFNGKDIRGAFSHDTVEDATGSGATSMSASTRRVLRGAASRIADGARRAIEQSGRAPRRAQLRAVERGVERFSHRSPRPAPGRQLTRAQRLARRRGEPPPEQRRAPDGEQPAAGRRPRAPAARAGIVVGAGAAAAAPPRRRLVFGAVRSARLLRRSGGIRNAGDGQPAGRVDLPSTWGAGWHVVRAPGKRGPPESFGTVHPYAAQWVVQQVDPAADALTRARLKLRMEVRQLMTAGRHARRRVRRVSDSELAAADGSHAFFSSVASGFSLSHGKAGAALQHATAPSSALLLERLRARGNSEAPQV